MLRDRKVHRDDEVQDSPVYWFSRFEHATLKADFALALKAQRRLRKLGFSVVRSHIRSQSRRTEGGAR